jgi:hypothetical protein
MTNRKQKKMRIDKVCCYRFPLDVSRALIREFKAVCAINGLKMSDVMLSFIKAYLGQNREEVIRMTELYLNKGVSE